VLALVTLAATALVSWQWLQYERARAAVAEGKAQRTSVERYMEEARVACQRGKWQDAVAIYDKALALEASQPDNVSLRLDKIKALVASLDVQSAIRELESLARGRDFQGREGSVLLWQADLALGPRFDLDQRLLLVRQALAKGLPPVEEAYAKSLLAESSPEAVSHLEFALRLDSTHYHANGMLTLMLLSLGRLKEARERAVFGEMLFPQDPAFKILQAVVCVLQDDAAAANRLLDEIQSVHGTEQTEPFRIAIRRLNKFRDSWDPWAPMNFDFKSALVDFLKLQTQLSRFSTQVPEQASPEEAIRSIGTSFCVPPCLRRGLGRLMHSLTSYALKPDSNKAIEELGEAIRLHPEGTLHYVRGMLFFCEERHEEAEKELVLATKTPAIFAVRLPALSFAAASEAKLAWDQPQHNEEMATRGLRNLRQRLALGPLHQEESYLFARMTRKAGEYDLARLVLSDWQWQAQEEVRKAKQDGRQPGAFAWAQLNPFNWQRQPQEDPRIQKEFMLLELEAGNYARAIEVAGKVLARDPKDPDAPGCRKEATDKLREQARQILAEKPAHAQGTDK
jgi:tetratricopeptide (TPR) repeat protein